MLRVVIGGVLLAFLPIALVCDSATAKPAKPAKQEKPGKGGSAKWDYTVRDEDGKLVEKGVFYAKDEKIINNKGKQVGTYEDVSATYVKAEVFEGKLKGTMRLRRQKSTSLTWNGELLRPSGGKYKITVVFETMK